jgi:hypothetical protein
MKALEIKHAIKLMVSHVSGLRMIAEGGDGKSRGILNEGVMAGESMLSFIPLNLSRSRLAYARTNQDRQLLDLGSRSVTSSELNMLNRGSGRLASILPAHATTSYLLARSLCALLRVTFRSWDC